MKILVLEGPNLNMVGIREIETYGGISSSDQKSSIDIWAKSKGNSLTFKNISEEGSVISGFGFEGYKMAIRFLTDS